MPLFLDTNHNVRSGWKFALYVAVFVASWYLTGLLFVLIYEKTSIPEGVLTILWLNILARFLAAVMATLFMAGFVDHLPLSAFGISLHSRWIRDLGSGLVIAGGMLLLLLLGSAIFGNLQMEWAAGNNSLASLAGTAGILVVAAASEEVLFRGYPLQALMKGLGTWPAVIVMSCVFGLLHALNPDSSVLGVANTIIAGLMLSLAYMKTRSLWFPYGIHVGWNLGLGVVAGFPLSGLSTASLWTAHISGSPAILGGAYGPEGGALGTLIFIAGAAAARGIPSQNLEARKRP